MSTKESIFIIEIFDNFDINFSNNLYMTLTAFLKKRIYFYNRGVLIMFVFFLKRH